MRLTAVMHRAMQRMGLRNTQTLYGPTLRWGRFGVFWQLHDGIDPTPGCVVFRCNVCGQMNQVYIADLHRELRSCRGCGSTVRFRAIVHLLAQELLDDDVMLPDFPVRALAGVGLSDWEGYAAPLAARWQYTNTFYHCEPFLDITSIDLEQEGTLDFLISSDVFEHIVPPVSVAFENAWRLLKPGGVLILTVPYVRDGDTQEHFPDLFRYEILEENGNYVLYNETSTGVQQRFNDLVFHAGEGVNLEMRMFSEGAVLAALEEAGFVDIQIRREPCYEHGIIWLEDRHLPFTARKPC